jgi:flagellar assembly factor FliW
MKIHIEPKDEMTTFELTNIFRLNYENIECSHQTLKSDDDKEMTVLTVEPRYLEDDEKYDVQRKVEKLLDTIQLAHKLGVIK